MSAAISLNVTQMPSVRTSSVDTNVAVRKALWVMEKYAKVGWKYS